MLVVLLAATTASAAPDPQSYGANDARGFVNILPPGQDGHADAGQVIAFTGLGTVFDDPAVQNQARPKHSSDQLDPYEDLVFNSPTLASNRLLEFYKDATFGVREGQEELRYIPRGDVTITRDESFGVPHIYGEARGGAMFGAGYVGAEDRLFLMDVLRHAGRAELSSFVGGAQSNRELDREQWRIAPYREADLQRQFDQGDDLYGDPGKQVQEDVLDYVEGINKYICEAAPARAAECASKGISNAPTSGSKNGSTPATMLPGAYGAITPNGESGPAANQPQLWKVTDVIATASLVGGIFGKGGGREVDAAKVIQEAIAKFGEDEGRKAYEDFRSREDPEAPTTASASFPYRVPPSEGDLDDESLGRPDSGTVEDSPVVSSGGGATRRGGILPGGLRAGSSNALLVSGAQTQSGRPVAVFGPQTGYFSPQLLMEIDIHAPASESSDGKPRQGIDARGAAFAGVNLYVQLGRGRDYAWSATSAGQDIVDTFALELCQPEGEEPAEPSELDEYKGYRYRGECQSFEPLVRENKWVLNAADQSAPGTETLRANRTKLGIEASRAEIDDTPHVYVKLRSTYFHEADSAGGFVDFNDPERMGNPDEFKQSASRIGFTFNWFFINRKDIAYFNSGNNPVRKGQTHPDFPVRACAGFTSGSCPYEWRNWDPDTWTADYTPASEHPQAVNSTYLTSWNNKQAPAYRAADDNFAYQPLHRSLPLDDNIQARIGGGKKITRVGLVDAMEAAGTVDLRGAKLVPLLLEVVGDDPALAEAIAKLRAWHEDGAHRRDRNDDGTYEHADAVRIMDAWWPRLVEAQFKPAMGDDFYAAVRNMVGLHDAPGPLGSAFISGWYGYVHKDLRSLLGRDVEGSYSREYCGEGDLADCRAALRSSLAAAVAEPASSVYPGGPCEDEDGSQQTAQYCNDAVRHTAVGAITQPPIHWINRPTFQQAVEVEAAQTGRGGDDGGDGGGGQPEDADEPRTADGSVPTAAGGAGDGGNLPFTGLSLLAVVLAALALLGGGVTARRRLRRR